MFLTGVGLGTFAPVIGLKPGDTVIRLTTKRRECERRFCLVFTVFSLVLFVFLRCLGFSRFADIRDFCPVRQIAGSRKVVKLGFHQIVLCLHPKLFNAGQFAVRVHHIQQGASSNLELVFVVHHNLFQRARLRFADFDT